MNLEAQLAAADARVAETMAARDEALHLLALAQLVYNEAVATDRNFETALGDRDFAIDGFLTSQFGYHLALGVWSPLYDGEGAQRPCFHRSIDRKSFLRSRPTSKAAAQCAKTAKTADMSKPARSRMAGDVDGRSKWARRLRVSQYEADLGGETMVTTAERSIVRRVATLQTELERYEAVFAAAGEASGEQIDLYARISGNLRRLLEAIGTNRRPRDITPSLVEYLATKPHQE
jgi:hypothetical protein